MDEPLSNLDALLRVKMRSELKKLQERLGVTTIYVTHDQIEAMTMGDRIAVMFNGKILQFGKSSDIYHKPVNIFVAGFIGSPQMNFFKMKVKSEGTRFFAEGEGIKIPLKKDPGVENLIVGIRPEHIYLEKEGNVLEVKTKVYFTEKLMSETIIHTVLNGTKIVVRVPGDEEFNEGEDIKIYFDLDRIHLFNAENERRIEI